MDQTFTSARAQFNPKRRIAQSPSPARLAAWLEQVCYKGNPTHKRNPGDFGLEPPSDPRPDKSLCDWTEIFERAEAGRLLRLGVAHGMVSRQIRGDFPQNIWVVRDGVAFEAILENQEKGEYHGYPMAQNDPFRDDVLLAWSET